MKNTDPDIVDFYNIIKLDLSHEHAWQSYMLAAAMLFFIILSVCVGILWKIIDFFTFNEKNRVDDVYLLLRHRKCRQILKASKKLMKQNKARRRRSLSLLSFLFKRQQQPPPPIWCRQPDESPSSLFNHNNEDNGNCLTDFCLGTTAHTNHRDDRHYRQQQQQQQQQQLEFINSFVQFRSKSSSPPVRHLITKDDEKINYDFDNKQPLTLQRVDSHGRLNERRLSPVIYRRNSNAYEFDC